MEPLSYITSIPETWIITWTNVVCQVTVLLSAGLAASFCLRRSATLGYAVMATALVISLATPLTIFNYPTALTSVLNSQRSRSAETHRRQELEDAVGSVRTGQIQDDTGALQKIDLEPAVANEDAPTASSAVAVPGRLVSATLSTSIGRRCVGILILVWGLGCLLVFVKTVWGYAQITRMLKLAKPASDFEQIELLRRVSAELGLRSTPSLWYSSEISSPIAIGTIFPKVVMPLNINSWIDANQLKSVFVHEVAHLKRWDPGFAHIQNGARILLWAHPLYGIASRWLNCFREAICDNYVLSRTEPAAYSRTLLSVAEGCQPANRLMTPSCLLADGNSLETRISGILKERRRIMTRSTSLGRAAVLVWIVILSGVYNWEFVKPIHADDPVELSRDRAALDQDLAMLVLKSSDAASILSFKDQAAQLLDKYDGAASRGQILIHTAVALSSTAKVSPDAQLWAQAALKYPMARADRLRALEIWSTSASHSQDASHAWLPAIVGFIEASLHEADDAKRVAFANKLEELYARNGSRARGVLNRALAAIDHSALPKPASDTLPAWVPKNCVSAFSFQVDWDGSLDDAALFVNQWVDHASFFENVLESLAHDPNGPQVDLVNDVVPYLGNRVTLVVDYREPLIAHEPRLLVGLELSNSQQISKLLEALFQDDPAAVAMTLHGKQAWKVTGTLSSQPMIWCVANGQLFVGERAQLESLTK